MAPLMVFVPAGLFGVAAILAIVAGASAITGTCSASVANLGIPGQVQMDSTCLATLYIDLSALYVIAPVAFASGFFCALSTLVSICTFVGKIGKTCPVILGVIGCVLGLASTIILGLNRSYWSDNECQAAAIYVQIMSAGCAAGSSEACGLAYDGCELATRAICCALISFVCTVIGTCSWCCVDINPGQPVGHGVQAPLLIQQPGINSAAPDLLQQMVGSGVVHPTTQQPPMQQQQQQQQQQQFMGQHIQQVVPAQPVQQQQQQQFMGQHIQQVVPAQPVQQQPPPQRAVSTSPAAPSPSASITSNTEETPATLAEFCVAHKLEQFQPALNELGVEAPSDFADVTNAELAAVGLKTVQINRLRRQVPAVDATGAAQSAVAGLSRPASPSRQVQAAVGASRAASPSRDNVGGSE